MTNLLNSLLIPIVTIVGLIVLIAIGKISPDVAVPIIAALAGVHVGANSLSTPTTIAAPPTVTKSSPPPLV